MYLLDIINQLILIVLKLTINNNKHNWLHNFGHMKTVARGVTCWHVLAILIAKNNHKHVIGQYTVVNDATICWPVKAF